jgi:hypothetical protein
MLGAVDLSLYFLGRRDYVNGVTLFEEMLKAFSAYSHTEVTRPYHIKLCKINKFVRDNAWMEISRSEDAPPTPRLKGASVRIDLLTASGPFTLLLFTKHGQTVTHHGDDYDRGGYVAEDRSFDDGSTVAKLRNLQDVYDLMRGITEVNYRFVTAEAKKLDIQQGASWAYLADFPFFIDPDISSISTVRFNSKSILSAYGKRFTIRTFHIDGKGGADSEICFFTDEPG